jgi:UDP-N-acetylglucosamine 3-dehydrogenase
MHVINVLVIGAGTMGTVHSNAYMAMENVNLVGIVDIRKEKADAVAGGKVPTFTSFEEAISEVKDFDVVDVCLPTYLHKGYVLKGAGLGKHVVCEKPLARSLEDARDLIHTCKTQNVKLFVGHVLRFFPEYVQAKSVIDSGKIGKPGVVRTFRGGVFPTAWNDWYADFKNSGGLVLDMIIHDIDFLRWCFGEVERVYAKSLLGRGFARKDYDLLTIRFKNGVIAHVEGSWAHEGFSMTFEIAGDKGIIDYNSSKETPLFLRAQSTKEATSGGVAVPESPMRNNPYFYELEHFMHCIETDETPRVTPEDAYKAVEISLAALKSIETGQPVLLNPVFIEEV